MGLYGDIEAFLIHGNALSEQFYDLSTGLAGAFLQKFVNYRLRVALVIPAERIGNGRFQEMARELVCEPCLTGDSFCDFQVIWEADALVNIPASWGKRAYEHTLPELIELNFRTRTGNELIMKWAREQL